MRPDRRQIVVATIVGLTIAWHAAVACGQPAAGPDGEIVLTVGTATVTRAEFEAQLRRLGLDPALPDEQLLRPQAVVIEQMIEERLLRAALKEDRIAVDKPEVDAALDRIRAQLASRKVTFADFLKQTGGTEAALRAQASLELGVDKMIRQRMTPALLATTFETRRREFDGTLLRVSHVILRPDAGRGDDAVKECLSRANGIRNEILQGELGFGAAARRYSAGPSRHRDGDVGLIPRYGVAEEEFAKQAFALAKGDISKPFATSFGIHIVTVTNVKPGTIVPEVVRQNVERALAQQLLRDRLAEIRKTTVIEYAPRIPHFDRRSQETGTPPDAIVVSNDVTREGG